MIRSAVVSVLTAALLAAGCASSGNPDAGQSPRIARADAISDAAGYCSAVETRPLVVRRACSEIPALRDPAITETEAATLLREWAATWIDIAATSKTLVEDDYWRLDIDSMYRAFSDDVAGVFCADAAWTLVRLYDAFGLRAWSYSFGFKSSLTHAVTLVEADGLLIVEDVYLNYMLADTNGRPLDMHDVLRRLHSAGSTSGIHRLDGSSDSRRDVILTSRQRANAVKRRDPAWPWGTAANLSACRQTPDGNQACRISGINWKRFSYWGDLPLAFADLRKRGRPQSLLQLMLFPIGIASPTDGWTASGANGTPTSRLWQSLVDAIRRTA